MPQAFTKPDFLCIGAQRSATTWLHRMLGMHPDVFLPFTKEMHYFTYPDQKVPDWLLGYRLTAFYNSFSQMMTARHADLRLLRWFSETCLAEYQDDDYYARVYEGFQDKICGDISPSYAALDEAQVGYVHARLPTAKIIFMMRDPAARTWSQLQKKLQLRAANKAPDDDQLRAHIDSEAVDFRSDYLRAIKNWEAHYSPDQMHYVFFDDVQTRPLAVLKDICDFAGISFRPDLMNETAEIPANVGSDKMAIPPALESYIAQKYLPMLTDLKTHLKSRVKDISPVERWIESAQKTANKA